MDHAALHDQPTHFFTRFPIIGSPCPQTNLTRALIDDSSNSIPQLSAFFAVKLSLTDRNFLRRGSVKDLYGSHASHLHAGKFNYVKKILTSENCELDPNACRSGCDSNHTPVSFVGDANQRFPSPTVLPRPVRRRLLRLLPVRPEAPTRRPRQPAGRPGHRSLRRSFWPEPLRETA